MPRAAPDAHVAEEEDNGDIPPAFNEDMTLREMKASFESNKGALTRLSNPVKVHAETFVAIKSPGSASQLNESYKKFLAKCNYLHRAAHQLALEDERTRTTTANARNNRTNLRRRPGTTGHRRPHTRYGNCGPWCCQGSRSSLSLIHI